MGSGKTAVLAEASDILSARGMVHAAIDLDALATARFASAARNDELMYANLRCIAENCAAAGIERVLLARAVENRSLLEVICRLVPAERTVVCRLVAGIETMQQRVGARDCGLLQLDLVARVVDLNDTLDRAGLEDFAVANENRPLTEVAMEMLTRAGWISG